MKSALTFIIRVSHICRLLNALSLSQEESGSDPRHCDPESIVVLPARRLLHDEARAVRVNPVAGAVAFGSRPRRAPSLSRLSTRTRRPGKFPLTRAAARRYWERRERAIGRARGISRAIENFLRSFEVVSGAIFAAIISRRFCIVSSVRLPRIAKVVLITVLIGRRKCDTWQRWAYVDFCRHGGI